MSSANPISVFLSKIPQQRLQRSLGIVVYCSSMLCIHKCTSRTHEWRGALHGSYEKLSIRCTSRDEKMRKTSNVIDKRVKLPQNRYDFAIRRRNFRVLSLSEFKTSKFILVEHFQSHNHYVLRDRERGLSASKFLTFMQ